MTAQFFASKLPSISTASHFLSVPDVFECDAKLLGPKERNCIERLTVAQNVPCRYLPLALCDYPVLDADPLAGTWIGPTRNVTRRKDSWSAGFEILVNNDASVDFQTGLFRKRDRGVHSHSQNKER
jgi:hypothetical protein